MRLKSIGTAGIAACACALSTLTACQTLQQLTALQNVSFELDGVRDVRLAGVRLDGIQSAGDLGLTGMTRILAAYASGNLPLELTADLLAENPADNSVTARLARLDWTMLLEGREAVSGSVGDPVSLAPGVPTVIPVSAGLDLLEFFDGSGQDLLDLVLALTGQEGGSSKELALRIQPTIETPLGPMRYPRPITVLKERVGGDR
jgi:hypothetical protein